VEGTGYLPSVLAEIRTRRRPTVDPTFPVLNTKSDDVCGWCMPLEGTKLTEVHDKEAHNLRCSARITGITKVIRSWDSSVGIATAHELDCPGLIPCSTRFLFSTVSRPTLRPTQPPIKLVPVTLIPGGEG
jgi:hypothetical protein